MGSLFCAQTGALLKSGVATPEDEDVSPKTAHQGLTAHAIQRRNKPNLLG